MHGSLLPAYRGAAPVQWAVLNGDPFAGVSIIHMTPKLDGGPILGTAKIPIEPHDTSGSLEAKLAELGVRPTLASIELLAQWNLVSAIGTPQDTSLVSRAPRLSKASGKIDWNRNAIEIDRHVRGMSPWPGAFTEIAVSPGREALRIAVRSVTIEPPSTILTNAINASPGTLIDDHLLRIATGPASSPGVIRIDRLQPAGRNDVSGEDFIRGHRLRAGTLLS